jgi:hypothetical protein
MKLMIKHPFEGAFYFTQEGDVMKLADHLSKEQKQQMNKAKSPKKKRKKKKDNLSFRDWENIMGTRRDTYERMRRY